MASKNVGKIFEKDFADSVPNHFWKHRLKDSAQSFNQSGLTSFTWDNPCDFFMFDTINFRLFCLELKSTKAKSMAFDDIKQKKSQKKMIKKHQIESLMKFSEYDGIVSGFIFNFRQEEDDTQRTYFMDIDNFRTMCNTIGKVSFNESDLVFNKAIVINGNKKISHYKWDIESVIDKIYKRVSETKNINKEKEGN